MRRLLRPGRTRTWVAFGTAVAVAGGLVVRFWCDSSLWSDEAVTVNIASLPWGDVGAALRHDAHPPLYYALLHGWIDLFGDTDVAVRSLSAVWSILTLPLMWRLGRRTGGPAVARWSLLLLVLSPFAVQHAAEARMFSLVMFLVVAGSLTLESVLTRPRAANVAALTLICGALLWTHYWSLYLLAAVGALLALRWYRSPAERRTVRWAFGAMLGGGMLFLPWLPSLLSQAAHTGTPWGRPSRPTVIAQVTVAGLGGGDFAEALLLGTVLVVLGVAAFAHLDRITLRERAEPLDARVLAVLAGGTLLLGSAVSYVAGTAFAARDAAVIAPLVLVVVAVGLTRMRPIWLQRAMGAVIVLLASVAIVHNVREDRTSADKVAAQIEDDAGRRDVVVVCPDQLGPSLERALRQRDLDLDVVPYPGGGDPRFVDWRDYEDRIDEADPRAFATEVLDDAGTAPIWVVWAGGYRTLQDDCEDLVMALQSARSGTQLRAEEGTYESASLIHFP